MVKLNLEENKLDYKKELSLKEKVLRDTQIRSMHEMGEMKRAQELRVDELYKKNEKVMKQYKGSLRNCRVCKNR